jgi:Zn-dependent oligopeptidase
MEELDPLPISGDIEREYGYLICAFTEIFYYGILKGIDSAVHNTIYIFKNSKNERPFNIQENINNLKTALEYLASEDILERFFGAYLKRVEEKFHNDTGYTISKLLESGYKISDLLRIIGNKGFDRNTMYLLNIKAKNVMPYLDTLSDLAWEESEKVANIVKNLVKYPEKYKKDFEEYIEYKAEK